MFDSALLEHSPSFQRLVCLLHALLEFLKHLLPALRVCLLVVVHGLDESHVEVLRREFTLVKQLFVFLQILHFITHYRPTFDVCHAFLTIVTVFKVIVIVVLLDPLKRVIFVALITFIITVC